MKHGAQQILSILDDCCGQFTFPMLDNGYVYLAATRLSLFRSQDDWAMTIEVFGFSPRSGLPDTHIHTFGSEIYCRREPHEFVNRNAYENYLTNNPNNESKFIFPIAEGDWLDGEFVSKSASEVIIREKQLLLPVREEYQTHGIELASEESVRVFELCRFLASIKRRELLAKPEELRSNIQPSMTPILQLDEWHHPDVVDDTCRPSGSVTFQQLAKVLETGDIGIYQPAFPPNTHWSNWPDGGTL